MSSQPPYIEIAKWSRSANDTIIVKLDEFKGTAVIDIRAWWTSPHGELRPGHRGITMAVHHLPLLAHALIKAEAVARELGLIPKQNDA